MLLVGLSMGAACNGEPADDPSVRDATAVVESLRDAGIDCAVSEDAGPSEASCRVDDADVSVRTFVDDEARDEYLEGSDIFSPVVLAPQTLVIVSEKGLAGEIARVLDGDVRAPGGSS